MCVEFVHFYGNYLKKIACINVIANHCQLLSYTCYIHIPKTFQFQYYSNYSYIYGYKRKKLYFEILKTNSYYTDDGVLDIIYYNIREKILSFVLLYF